MDFHDTARGERDYRYGPGHIRAYHARNIQFSRGIPLGRGGQRKLTRVVYFDYVDVSGMLYKGRGRRLGGGIAFVFGGATSQQDREEHGGRRQ